MFAFFQTKKNDDDVICNIFYTGDFFRKLWGPYAGWTQSVSGNTQYVSMRFCLDMLLLFNYSMSFNCFRCCSVLILRSSKS